jgi:hypothetical protein
MDVALFKNTRFYEIEEIPYKELLSKVARRSGLDQPSGDTV